MFPKMEEYKKKMTEKFYDVNAEVDKDGEKQDLGVYEARQLNKRYSDDTWQLIGYTSELRNKKDNSFFAFVDFGSDNEGTIRECPHCLQYQIHNKLGPKIKKNGEPPAPDDEIWMSCYNCGQTFPAYQTFPESQIKDSLETTTNPFESNESVFMSTDSRATTRRKRELRDGHRKGVHKYKSRRIDYENKEDPDIQREIDKGNNVNIIQ